MDKNDFYLKFARALAGCQLVEQQLKLYITEALLLVQKCIGEKMSFKMEGKDYANFSLEKLIETFTKLTNNTKLVKDLNKFKEERNYVSHQGITYCLDYERELDHPKALELQRRLDNIENEAERLYALIHEEANKFRGHLWFDDLNLS